MNAMPVNELDTQRALRLIAGESLSEADRERALAAIAADPALGSAWRVTRAAQDDIVALSRSLTSSQAPAVRRWWPAAAAAVLVGAVLLPNLGSDPAEAPVAVGAASDVISDVSFEGSYAARGDDTLFADEFGS